MFTPRVSPGPRVKARRLMLQLLFVIVVVVVFHQNVSKCTVIVMGNGALYLMKVLFSL